jgi:hypothetical protein
MPAVEGRRRWRRVREGGEVWGVYERGKSARRALSRVLWGKGEREGAATGPIGHQWQGKHRRRRRRFQLETKEKG